MKFPMYINEEKIKHLEYEVLSQEFYILLTRILLSKVEDLEESNLIIAQKNRLINRASTIKGKKIYVLESDSYGNYEQAEHDWHDGKFFLILRTLTTIQFIEFMIELFKLRLFKIDEINLILEKEAASFQFEKMSDYDVNILSDDDIEKEIEANFSDENSHPNIRILIKRMDLSYENNDYASVLHASASVFETMAKDIIGIDSIQNETLKSFFDRYRIDSKLPEELLNYILSVYDDRNTTPLAGHGSLSAPNINKEIALTLREFTKAFVRIEYELKTLEV